MKSHNFYRDIPAFKLSIADVFQEKFFYNVPDDWVIIVADIQNSTAAVADGKHNDVNLVAAGSLVAGLNIAKGKQIEIPFFFSGDGGTLLVPEVLAKDIMTALQIHNENSIRNFGLALHLGSLEMKAVLASNASLKIAKVQQGSGFNKAIVLGDGLKFAEKEIKQRAAKNLSINSENTLNMAGLECRWDKIKPPSGENEIVCYLIDAKDQEKQLEVYRNVLKKADEIYGSLEHRSPLSLNRLNLLLNLRKVEKEMFVKFGKWNPGYFLRTFFTTLLGIFYFRNNLKLGEIRARDYLSQIIANADTLTVDGRINTIISGQQRQRMEFVKYLNEQESQGILVFGHHISKESIMTCYIEHMNADHIHFVDGSDGGYTEAAKQLKDKLK